MTWGIYLGILWLSPLTVFDIMFAGMMQGLRQVPHKSDEIIGKWQSDLKAFCKSQQRDIENYIQFQTTEQTKQILKETQV
jgi:hypothetical protein